MSIVGCQVGVGEHPEAAPFTRALLRAGRLLVVPRRDAGIHMDVFLKIQIGDGFSKYLHLVVCFSAKSGIKIGGHSRFR